ncbi:L,D-transpeptidase [Streptomyces sp. YIM B13508]|uniref:L,D-transpeptidase n=1 Tax=Streptomyces sp. YIM B13508 TaxID=3366315 RepID=UPI0036AF11B9
MSTITTRLARTATAALATTSIFLLAGLTPTAQAEEAGAAAKGSATAANTVYLKFDKNPKYPFYSKLSVIKGSTVWATFRAGSGITENECTTGRGWLPNGTYTVGQHYKTYNGNLIKGYAIHLSDKRCNNGTGRWRTQLFIHSEMNRDGSQGSTERRKWTDKNPNDFLSNGCIKMRPEEIKKLFRLLDRIGWPKTLKVVS